ncbi:MAG: hypothetical protein V4498_00280 [candidate division FCPU426 bacterium]
MEKRVYDEKTRRKLAGFLSHKRGEISRFTPDFMNVGEGSPAFLVSPLGDAEFDAQRGKNFTDTEAARQFLKDTFGKSGLMGWEGVPGEDESDLPSTAESIDIFVPILVWVLFNHLRNSAYGVLPDEAEGLESSPPSASEPSSKTADGADTTPA